MAIASSKAMIVSTSMSPSNNHTRSLSGLSQTVPCAAWLVTAGTPTATTRTENASAREPARSACPAHQCCNHRDEVHKERKHARVEHQKGRLKTDCIAAPAPYP